MTEFTVRQSVEMPQRESCGWLKTQGYAALVNLVALLTVSLIFTLLIQHRVAWASTLYLYGKRYKLACIILVMLCCVIAYVIFKGGRLNNRRMSVVFLVCLIAAELAAQHTRYSNPFYMPYNTPHPYICFSGENGKQVQNKRLANRMGGEEAPISISLNELGYRGPLPSLDKNDEYRVIMLGGSTVFVGSPLNKTLPGQLETILHDADLENVRIYNWGLVSGVSGQELSAMAHRAIDFKPDLIVVYNGSNDSNAPMSYDPRPGYPFNYFVSEVGQQFSKRHNEPRQLALVLLQQSSAIRYLLGDLISPEKNYLANLRKQCGYNTDAWRDTIAQTYGNNLSRMAIISKGSGSKLAVFLQPLLTHKIHQTNAETKILMEDALRSHIQYTYPRMAAAARSSLDGREVEGVYFSDFRHVLADVKEDIFWDYVHVNNLGNELIAHEMADRLLPIIRDDIEHSAILATRIATSP